jgi:hypothetical protein
MQASERALGFETETRRVGLQRLPRRFSKLFMALLQTEFSKNDDARVKSVINDQVSTDYGRA